MSSGKDPGCRTESQVVFWYLKCHAGAVYELYSNVEDKNGIHLEIVAHLRNFGARVVSFK